MNNNPFITFPGAKFLCSEIIAPIQADDVSLFIINFEDLSFPETPDELEPAKLTRCKLGFPPFSHPFSHISYQLLVGKARASFRQSFRFGSMNIRDRGLRLAGYLTPPSDITQEDDDGTHAAALAAGAIAIAGAGASSSLTTIETGVIAPGSKGTNNQRASALKVDKPPWAQLSAPALTSTPENNEKDYSNTASTYVTDEIRLNVPTAPIKVSFFSVLSDMTPPPPPLVSKFE